MRTLRRLPLLLVTLAAGSVVRPAEADEPAGTEVEAIDQARALFVRGTELAKRGSWREALDAFERSAKLKAHPVTRYNIAYCERAMGHYARALLAFTQALAAHEARDENELPADLLYSARVYRSEVEAKVARLMLEIPPGAQLTVDGAAVIEVGERRYTPARSGEAATDALPESFELVLDPGVHTFRVSKMALRQRVVRRQLAAGSNDSLVMELGVGAAHAALPALTPVRREAEASPVPQGEGDYAWPIVTYGVSAAAFGVGALFGVRVLDQERELDRLCPNQTCSRRHQDRLDAANRDATISTAAFGVGIASAAVGTYLLLGQQARASESRAVAPRLGAGFVGVAGGF